MLYEIKENISLNWKGQIVYFYENELIDSNIYDPGLIEHLNTNYNIIKASKDVLKQDIKAKQSELKKLETELENDKKRIIQLKSEIAILDSYLK